MGKFGVGAVVRLRTRVGVGFLVLLESGVLSLVPSTLQADGTTEVPTPAGAAAFQFSQPPAFQPSGGMAMANVFASCFGNVGSIVSNLGTAISTGANAPVVGMGSISANSSCPPTSEVREPSCTDIMTGNTVNQSRVGSLRNEISMQIGGLLCKKGKFEAIRAELSCMQSQAQQLTQQISSLQQAYIQNIQRMQAEVSSMKTVIDERSAQAQETERLLNGTGGTGQKGLLQLQQEASAMLQSLPQQISQVREQQQSLVNQRRAFEEQVQSRTMALSSDCFKNKSDPSWRCERNGPPVTAYEYVQCITRDRARIGEGNEVRNDATTTARADARAAQVKSVLDGMLGESPSQTAIPTSPEAGQSFSQQSVSLLSMADVESRYGAQFANFDTENLPVRDFVMTVMGSCYQDAQRTVTRERNRADSPLGQTVERMNQAERQIGVISAEVLRQGSDMYTNVLRGLTGQQPAPLNTNACNGAAPDVQVNCLQDLQNNLNALVGNAGNSPTIGMRIQGRIPSAAIPIACRGLANCIGEIQNVNRFVTQERDRVTGYREQYILAANQGVERFTAAMAQQMQGMSAMLTNRVQQMNSALASLGASGISVNPLQAEQLQKDENGLYRAPNNVVALIGGQMSPPMLDISGSTFSDALGGLASGTQETDQQLARAQQLPGRLESLISSCSSERVNNLASTLQGDVDQLAQCTQYADCGASASRLQELSRTIGDLGTTSMDPAVLGGLESGISGSCPGGVSANPGGAAAPNPVCANKDRCVGYLTALTADQVTANATDCGFSPVEREPGAPPALAADASPTPTAVQELANRLYTSDTCGTNAPGRSYCFGGGGAPARDARRDACRTAFIAAVRRLNPRPGAAITLQANDFPPSPSIPPAQRSSCNPPGGTSFPESAYERGSAGAGTRITEAYRGRELQRLTALSCPSSTGATTGRTAAQCSATVSRLQTRVNQLNAAARSSGTAAGIAR